MKPVFSFEVDHRTDLVRITMAGFFEIPDIEQFKLALARAHRLLTCAPNEHVTVLDICGMKIQSQAAVADFAEILKTPRYASKRIAVVVSQSLARMQIQRAAASRDVAYFNDQASAERWLISGIEDAA